MKKRLNLTCTLVFFLFPAALLAADTPEARFAAMSPEDIRASERDTLQRVADLSLIPPVINTDPLPEYDYDRNRGTDAEILFARFTEEDILAGKLVTPTPKLRVLVCRLMKPKKK